MHQTNPKPDPRRKAYLKTLTKSVYDYNRKIMPEDKLKYETKHDGYLVTSDDFNFIGKQLSHGEYRLWMALKRHADFRYPTYQVVWPGEKRLAVIMGISTRQVGTYLRGLKTKGLLISCPRQDKTKLRVLIDPPLDWSQSTKKKLAELKDAYSRCQQTV